jgi:hypothetical protein
LQFQKRCQNFIGARVFAASSDSTPFPFRCGTVTTMHVAVIAMSIGDLYILPFPRRSQLSLRGRFIGVCEADSRIECAFYA